MISFSQLKMWEPTAIGALLAWFRTSGLWLEAISHQAKLVYGKISYGNINTLVWL